MAELEKKICIRCNSKIADNRNYVCEKCWNEASETTKMELELLCRAFNERLIEDDGELKC